MHNPSGALRVVVTKALPGDRWLKVLTAAGCRVEVSADPDTILSNDKIKRLIGDKCDGLIGQLTEVRREGAQQAATAVPRALPPPLFAAPACSFPGSANKASMAALPVHPISTAAVLFAPACLLCSALLLPQDWGAELFGALKAAGGRAYSNYAVGYNNVVVPEATKVGIPVGNTPGELGMPQ